MIGGAVLVLDDAEIDLVNSLFESNYDGSNYDASGVGVVSLGGQVQCDVEDCLPVCTSCLRETVSPSPHPAAPSTNEENATVPTVIASTSALLVLVLVGLLTLRHRLNATSVTCHVGLEHAAASFELPDTISTLPLTRYLLEDTSVHNPPDPHVSFELLRVSRAAIFVVDRSLRVELWSAGMRMAAPMFFDPVNRHISDLPFVDALAGSQCRTIIYRPFMASEEQNGNVPTTEQLVLLHLYANSGRQVLLEMVVNVVTEGSERHAVLIGREVNSDLATLMANEGTAVSKASSSVSWASDRGVVMPTSRATAVCSPSPSVSVASGLAEANRFEDSDMDTDLSDRSVCVADGGSTNCTISTNGM